MASFMALREGWTDKEGNVEPVQFEGASLPAFSILSSLHVLD